MSNKIPTAEEFYKYHNHDNYKDFDKTCLKGKDVKKAMIEFAKLHVKAALEAALESIPCLGSSTDIATYEEVKKEVLNAYPENLIV